MKRVIVTGVNEFGIQEVEIPKIECDKVLVRMVVASVCNQTDLHILEGTHPPASSFPAIFGHEGAGIIEKVSSGVSGFKPGGRVAVRGHESGCYSEYCRVDLKDLSLIPDEVSFEIASISEIAGGSYCLVRQTVELGDTVIILGQGASGLIATQLVKASGARLIVISNPSSAKRELGIEYGADYAINPKETDVLDFAKEITNGQYFDVALEYVGIPQTMELLPYLIRPQGTIGIFGACCGAVPKFDMMEFHMRFARMFSTGYEYAYSAYPYDRTIGLIAAGILKLDKFITYKLPMSQLHKAFDIIRSKDKELIKILIDIWS